MFPLDRKVARRCNRFVVIAARAPLHVRVDLEPAKHDGFGWTNLCTGRNEAALLAIVTKSALEMRRLRLAAAMAGDRPRRTGTTPRNSHSRCRHRSARAPS